MCLACEMDNLWWQLYQEQQAAAAKKSATDAGSLAPLPAQNKSEPPSAFVCEEPSDE
jgi:hypothetical protein